MLSDSESESDSSGMDVIDDVQEPAPDVKGLALAEHYFGPLLSPVTATAAQWTAYTQLRLATNAKHKNVFSRRKQTISDSVAIIEEDLGLDKGTLQKCVSIIDRWVEWDDESPRDSDIAVRIFSPATPKFIDVHLKYHHRPRYYSVEWFYSLGYKIGRPISAQTPFQKPSTDDTVDRQHARHGWQSICWGYYGDSDIEEAGMGLYEEGVLDIYETFFGLIEPPPGNDDEAMLEYRRKLVTTVRLLLAAVGMQYMVACTDEEEDQGPSKYMLEGMSDKWVARGIRKACGFQLSGDADREKRGQKERETYAREEEDDDDGDDDDEDEDEECSDDDY